MTYEKWNSMTLEERLEASVTYFSKIYERQHTKASLTPEDFYAIEFTLSVLRNIQGFDG